MNTCRKVLTFSVLLLTSTCLSAQSAIVLPSGGICAHRGAKDTHPENTITAFKEAVRLGVQMIELDVQLTKDGYLVILHDNTVDRTTNGTGKINDLTLEEVKKLDAGSWKSPDFKEERIPTLKEALSVIPENIWINVHLKGGAEMGTKVAQTLVDQMKENQAFIACGQEAAAAAKNYSSDILICNMDRQGNMDDYVNLTLELESDFIQLYRTDVNPKIKAYTSRLKQKNIKVNYCCTDSPEELAKLIEYGVDFVLVNEVERMMSVAESLSLIPSSQK